MTNETALITYCTVETEAIVPTKPIQQFSKFNNVVNLTANTRQAELRFGKEEQHAADDISTRRVCYMGIPEPFG